MTTRWSTSSGLRPRPSLQCSQGCGDKRFFPPHVVLLLLLCGPGWWSPWASSSSEGLQPTVKPQWRQRSSSLAHTEIILKQNAAVLGSRWVEILGQVLLYLAATLACPLDLWPFQDFLFFSFLVELWKRLGSSGSGRLTFQMKSCQSSSLAPTLVVGFCLWEGLVCTTEECRLGSWFHMKALFRPQVSIWFLGFYLV